MLCPNVCDPDLLIPVYYGVLGKTETKKRDINGLVPKYFNTSLKLLLLLYNRWPGCRYFELRWLANKKILDLYYDVLFFLTLSNN